MVVYVKRQFFIFYNYIYMCNYIFITNLANTLPRYCIFKQKIIYSLL